MRIALVETAAYGGLLHYSVQMGDALAARGHEVDLITTRDNELAGRARDARMRAVLARPVATTRDVRSRPLYVARRAAIAVRLVRAWARVVWEARPGRYDVVIVGADVGLPPATVGALVLSAVPGRTRLVRIAHNVRATNRGGGNELYDMSTLSAQLLRRLYPRFDLVLVHGERSRAEFEETWGSNRVAVIPHGDERIFGNEPPPPSEEERILFFGDWRKVKGLPVLMEAFDELVVRRPTVRLTIAGSPATADWDPELVRTWAARHDGKVRLIDRYVPVEEVRAVFAAARIVVAPHLAGYQSGVIHLAMTMGRAVVASDVGDFAAAVANGQTGRVVAPGDPEELARALEELVADPAQAQRFGAEARRRVLAESSWERVAERVETELHDLRGQRALQVTVSRLRGAELDGLEHEWRELEERAPSASPYVGFDWLRAWARTYAPRDLQLVRIEDRDSVRALGLIEIRSGGRWRFAGQPVTPERAMLCEAGAEVDSWAAFSDWLDERPNRWATLEARGVRVAATWAAAEVTSEPVPVLPVPGSFDEYLAALSSSTRTDIRKKQRRFEHAGGLVRRVPADDLDAALDAFLELHKLRASQKGEAHPSIDTRLARFLSSVRGTPQWQLVLHEAVLNGRRLGVQITLQAQHATYLYNVGIDPEAGRFGVGILVTVAAIEEAIANRHTVVEMGPGTHGYKLSLGGQPDERLVLEARSRSLRGQALGLPARGYRWMLRHPRLAAPTRRVNEWRAGLKLPH